jgi:hypothetical protein
MRQAIAGILTLACLASAGCAAQEAPAPKNRIVATEGDLVLPLDAYDLVPDRRAVVQTARYRLIEQCLSDFGLRFPGHDTSPVHYPRNAAYLGWLGAKQVRKFGYTGPPGQVVEQDAAVSGIRGYTIPPEQEAVHTGIVAEAGGRAVPDGGCDGAAQRVLNGDARSADGKTRAAPHEYKQLYVFMDDAAQLAHRDPRIGDVDAAWANCMRTAGFGYTTPTSAERDPRWAGRLGADSWHPSSSDEIEVATADEKCRLDVDYSGVKRVVLGEAQRELIAEKEPELDRLRDLLATRYENALKVRSR